MADRESLLDARLWLAFAIMLFVAGVGNTFPVFFQPLLAEFGCPPWPPWVNREWGQVTLVTPERHVLVISDLAGGGGVALRTPGGAQISVSDAGIVIDNGQGAAITLRGGTVHVTGVMT